MWQQQEQKRGAEFTPATQVKLHSCRNLIQLRSKSQCNPMYVYKLKCTPIYVYTEVNTIIFNGPHSHINWYRTEALEHFKCFCWILSCLYVWIRNAITCKMVDDFPDQPCILVFLEIFQNLSSKLLLYHQHSTNPTVKRLRHLHFWKASLFLKPRKYWRNSPTMSIYK